MTQATAPPKFIAPSRTAVPSQISIDTLCWVVPMVIYLAVGIPVAIRNRFEINPDGIIYLRKAEFLLSGNIMQSISGYWSPGMTWCIAAAMKLSPHSAPLHVIHALLTASGWCCTVACCLLFYCIAPELKIARLVSGIAVALVSLRVAVSWMAPDLMLCTCLLGYFCCLLWPQRQWWMLLLAGVFAGLGFLCKSYALPFFLLHFPLTLAFQYFKSMPRGAWRKNLSLGLSGLAICVVPWSALLSYKYGKPTISMVYHHNHLNVASAEYLRATPDLCVLPPDPYLSIWEGLDPGPRVDWSPFSNAASFKQQMQIVVSHGWAMLLEVYKLDRAAVILLLALIALLPARWARGQQRSAMSCWLLMTAIVYSLGFLLVAFETRYVIPIFLPLGLALCVSETRRFEQPAIGIAIAALVLLVAVVELWPLAFFNAPRPIYRRAAIEMRQHHLDGVFSSTNNNNGFDVAWYLNQKVVLLPAAEDIATVERRLRAAGVENMLVWIDSRINKRDPFPIRLVSLMRRTRHWQLAFTVDFDSARRLMVYHWVG